MSDDDHEGVFAEGLGTTLDDVVSSIVRLCRVQLVKAKEDRALPNTPIDGDSTVRTLFLSLLPLTRQRVVFARAMGSQRDNLQRARSLFGAPPYRFLRPEDNELYNASAFSVRRINMAYLTESPTPGMHQFGRPHYLDDRRRKYRVCQDDKLTADNVLPNQLLESQPARVLFYVKYRRQLLPPRVGETVTLRPTSLIAMLREPDTPAPALNTLPTVSVKIINQLYNRDKPRQVFSGVMILVGHVQTVQPVQPVQTSTQQQ